MRISSRRVPSLFALRKLLVILIYIIACLPSKLIAITVIGLQEIGNITDELDKVSALAARIST
jgi:hypothetical protein